MKSIVSGLSKSRIARKPFLSSRIFSVLGKERFEEESTVSRLVHGWMVRVFDIRSLNILTDKDVLILASDGLWDVLSNEDAARIVQSALSYFDETDVTRYTMAAQELIIAARGNPSDSHRWTMNVGGPASMDDITVFVIPLKHALVPPKTEEDDDDDMLSLDN